MASCANCRYAEYSPSYDRHIGKNGDYSGSNTESDWYCSYHGEWLHTASGCCRDYEED